MIRVWVLLGFLISFCTGCLLKAPDVSVPPSQVVSQSSSNSYCQESKEPCGVLEMDLRYQGESNRWVYWKAEAGAPVYQPTPEFIASGEWDLRITTHFPLVGSNGGKTAEVHGLPGGKAALAAVPDEWDSMQPRSVAQVQKLPFFEDRLESIKFDGVETGEEFQNPLVNQIGPGLLKSYSTSTHAYQLSYRTFILRTVDGSKYYAIRFSDFNRKTKKFIIHWRKLL